MNPLISIIIPTFNREHLISETLNSIKNQSYKNWECIIIDDGSTDNTDQLLNQYCTSDKRFIYKKRPDHLPKGANACRNYGFELSNGQFINWFDSDDLMHEDKLQLQLEALTENPESPYCICQSNWYDKDTETDLGLRSKSIESNKRLEDYCLYNIVWLTTAPLWRQSFIEKNKLKFDASLHQSQEYDFHVKALSISEDYTVIDDPLLTLIKHSEAISTDIFTDLKLESNLKVKQRITQIHLKNFTAKGKLKWLEILTLFYKNLLINNKKKKAKKNMKLIFSALKMNDTSSSEKLKFKVRIILAYLSYTLTGKGYKLVKPLT